MRQRKLGSHTPPCHRRMVITTLFSVLLAALQRRPLGGGDHFKQMPHPYHTPPCQWPKPCFFFREGGGLLTSGAMFLLSKGGGVH